MCTREDIVLGRYEPGWRMRDTGVRQSFRKACFPLSNAKIKEILAGFFSVAWIAKAKKVFTTSLKQCRREVHIKYADHKRNGIKADLLDLDTFTTIMAIYKTLRPLGVLSWNNFAELQYYQ